MAAQDKLKLFFATFLVCAGVLGFYLIPPNNVLAQVGSIFLGVLLGGVVVWFSVPGRQFVNYAKSSVAEVKKVVWPTPQDAIKLTGLVVVFVFFLALFMWILDLSFSWFFYDILLRRN